MSLRSVNQITQLRLESQLGVVIETSESNNEAGNEIPVAHQNQIK